MAKKKNTEESAARKLILPSTEFSVDGKKYRFTVAAFRKDGKIIQAEEALQDAELLGQLVEIGAGVLQYTGDEDTAAAEEGGEQA